MAAIELSALPEQPQLLECLGEREQGLSPGAEKQQGCTHSGKNKAL
jgi:hypothetical protein